MTTMIRRMPERLDARNEIRIKMQSKKKTTQDQAKNHASSASALIESERVLQADKELNIASLRNRYLDSRWWNNVEKKRWAKLVTILRDDGQYFSLSEDSPKVQGIVVLAKWSSLTGLT